MDVIAANMTFFLGSFGWTVVYSFGTLVAASIVGALITATYTLAELKSVRGALSVIVNFIRGLPLLIVLFAVYYILPFAGVDIGRVLSALLGLTLFFAASISEVFRGAVESVPTIQIDVARALGITKRQRLVHIILPQASKLIAGPIVNEFVRIVKGTTLLSLLTIHELMLAARQVTATTFKGIEVYSTVGVMYFLFIYGFAWLGRRLERRLTYVH